MILKGLIIFFEILVSFLLQTSVVTNFRLADVVPDILMILTVSLSFIIGKNTGMIAGFSCGLLLDCTFGSLVGLFALIYSAIGYMCGFAHRIYDKDDYTLPLFLIGGAEFLFEFVRYVLFYLLKGDLDLGYYSVRFLFPRVIYTVMVSIILYRLLNLNNNLFGLIDEHREKKNMKTHDFKGYDILNRRDL